MTASYRERCLAQLKTNFEAVVAGAPALDPYTFAWSMVSRQELGDWSKGKSYALTILDQDELKREETNQTRVELQVFLEFEAAVPTGSDPSTHANLVLTEIERRIGDDPYLIETATSEQLVLNTRVTGTSLDVGSFTSKRVTGTVTVLISFRHGQRDPRAFV